MITNIAFSEDGTLTVTKDGVDSVYSTTAPVVHPDTTEVDLLMSDGSTKKFVPAA